MKAACPYSFINFKGYIINMQDEKRFIHLYTMFAVLMGVFILYASLLAGMAQPEQGGHMAASVGKKTAPGIELVGIDAAAGRIIVRNNMDSPIVKANVRIDGKWTLGIAAQILPDEFGELYAGKQMPEKGNLAIVVLAADGNAGELETSYDFSRLNH